MVVRSVNSRALSTAPPARPSSSASSTSCHREPPHGVGAHERQGAERLAAGHERDHQEEPKPTARRSRRCSSSAASGELLVGDGRDELRAALAYHARGPVAASRRTG